MDGYQDHRQYPSVWHEEENAITWSPTTTARFEPGTFDMDMMTRLTMSTDTQYLWDDLTSSPASMLSQSIGNTDPMDRHTESMLPERQSNSPNFGMQTTPQWHIPEHNLPWQSLDHACNADPYLHQHEMPYQALSSPPIARQQSLQYQQQQQHQQHIRQAPTSHPSQQPIATAHGHTLPDVFASTHLPLRDPPPAAADTSPGAHPQRKTARNADDLYTPRWVRHAGVAREGWCGWCAAWFTLRDSAYWYHMHYSHGVSQANSGKRLPGPACFRAFTTSVPVSSSSPPSGSGGLSEARSRMGAQTQGQGQQSLEWEVKCGKCARWMPLPPGDKWNTAYFRHTYKCYFKVPAAPSLSGSTRGGGERSGPSSPARSIGSPSRRPGRDML